MLQEDGEEKRLIFAEDLRFPSYVFGHVLKTVIPRLNFLDKQYTCHLIEFYSVFAVYVLLESHLKDKLRHKYCICGGPQVHLMHVESLYEILDQF